MIIERAVFRLDGQEEIVTLEDITLREDYQSVRENLYCPTEGCNCRLIYIPQGKKIAYFKKWNGDNHNENCPHYIETQFNGRSRQIAGVTASTLRDSHVSDILRGIYDTYTETAEEREERLRRQRENARARRNRRVDNQRRGLTEEIEVNNPTTSLEGATLREGERNPPVRRRLSVLDFNLDDVGNTEAGIGRIIAVQNNENQSVITIVDELERGHFHLYLEQVFFENAPTNISRFLEILSNMVEANIEILISCVGEVVNRNNRIGMLILGENYLRFNRMPLATLIMNRGEGRTS